MKRIAFSPRANLKAFLHLSPPSKGMTKDNLSVKVLDTLEDHGASFLNEIASRLDAPPSQVAAALWKLIWAGRVTNDSLTPVWSGKPRQELWRPGRRRAKGWSGGAGRWSLLPQVQGEETPEEIESIAHRLLARYGLVCRETHSLERLSIRWRRLYPVLSRLEWQGTVERRLFISGLSGVQFALREAVTSLTSSSDTQALVLLNTCDPANPYGPSSLFPLRHPHEEGFILRRHPGNYLVLQGGIPIIAIENYGGRLTPLVDLVPKERRAALALLPQLLHHETRTRSIRVKQWAGGSVTSSIVAEDLEAIGFMREDLKMIYYRKYARQEST